MLDLAGRQRLGNLPEMATKRAAPTSARIPSARPGDRSMESWSVLLHFERQLRAAGRGCSASMKRRATRRRASFGCATLLAVILAVTASARLLAADWPAFRGPTHDGISTERIAWPKSGPKEKWKINVGI